MHFVESVAKGYKDTQLNKEGSMNLRKFRLVELGPGRGLLMSDVLRCIGQLGGMEFLTSINMIEISEENTKTQQKAVMDQLAKKDLHFGYQYSNAKN